MLKIEFKDKSREPVWIMEKTFSIGRSSKNQLKISDDSVSLQHARIQSLGDHFVLKDLGSRSGTFVNGQRVTQKNVVCGDNISIGNIELEIADPSANLSPDHRWSLIADARWLSGQEFPIIGAPGQVLNIGRGSQCDLVFAGTHLSRQHAQITIGHDHLLLRDISGANATFVNDQQVSETKVNAGDQLRLDVYSFRVFGPGIKLPKPSASQRTIPDSAESSKISSGQKQWKSKPTSPGNREEINLYKKQYQPFIVAGCIIVGVLATATYVILGVLGVI